MQNSYISCKLCPRLSFLSLLNPIKSNKSKQNKKAGTQVLTLKYFREQWSTKITLLDHIWILRIIKYFRVKQKAALSLKIGSKYFNFALNINMLININIISHASSHLVYRANSHNEVPPTSTTGKSLFQCFRKAKELVFY